MRYLTLGLLLLALPAAAADALPDDVKAARTLIYQTYNFVNHDWNNPTQEEQARIMALAARTKPDMTAQEKCAAPSEADWELAKAGNLEARFSLWQRMAYNGPFLRGPESSRTVFANDMKTLLLHSLGAGIFLPAGQKHSIWNAFTSLHMEYAIFPSKLTNDSELENCLLTQATQECTALAISKHEIPTFEAFTAEIERVAPNGIQESCVDAK